MSYGGYSKKQTICCDICKKLITWDEKSLDDISFWNVSDKLRYHQKTDKACLRSKKIEELLDEPD